MKLIVLLGLLGACTAAPIFVIEPYSPLPEYNPPSAYAHEAVLLNSAMEATLPDHLKNHFYDDPKTAFALAQSSQLHNKEMQVINREADRIPRKKIFDVLQHAGLAH